MWLIPLSTKYCETSYVIYPEKDLFDIRLTGASFYVLHFENPYMQMTRNVKSSLYSFREDYTKIVMLEQKTFMYINIHIFLKFIKTLLKVWKEKSMAFMKPRFLLLMIPYKWVDGLSWAQLRLFIKRIGDSTYATAKWLHEWVLWETHLN